MRHRILFLAIPACVVLYGIAGAGDPAWEAGIRDAGAVVEERALIWTWQEDGDSEVREQVRIRIVNRRGLRYADKSVYYFAPQQSVREFTAATIGPGGSRVPIPDDLRRDEIVVRTGDLEVRRLQFTFPAAEPGSVLEWTVVLRRNGEPPLHTEVLQQDLPIERQTLTFRTRKRFGRQLEPTVYHRRSLEPACEVHEPAVEGPWLVQRLVCRHVPAYVPEPMAPPESDARLGVALAWSDVRPFHESMWMEWNRLWAGTVARFLSGKKREARRLLRDLAPASRPASERVGAILDFVSTQLEVTDPDDAWPEDVDPKARGADGVLADKGGTAPEVTLLAFVLLAEARIQVDLALLADQRRGRFVYAYPDVNQASHLVVQLRTRSGSVFLDPACRECPRGFPDYRHVQEGQAGIRIRPPGERPVVVSMAPWPAEANQERWEQTVTLGAGGEADVRGTVTWTAHQEVYRRRLWRSLGPSDRDDAFRRLLPEDARGVEVSLTDPGDLSVPLKATFRYTLPPQGAEDAGARSLMPADMFRHVFSGVALDGRSQPVRWPFPQAVAWDVRYVLPEGWRPEAVPGDARAETPELAFRSEWRRAGEAKGELGWRGRVELRRDQVQSEALERFRRAAADLERICREGVALRRAAGGEGP